MKERRGGGSGEVPHYPVKPLRTGLGSGNSDHSIAAKGSASMAGGVEASTDPLHTHTHTRSKIHLNLHLYSKIFADSRQKTVSGVQ